MSIKLNRSINITLLKIRKCVISQSTTAILAGNDLFWQQNITQQTEKDSLFSQNIWHFDSIFWKFSEKKKVS